MTKKSEKATEKTETRPPVVVVLGHVDHGKTSILDYVRKAHVAEKETGGITQHIGAYEITMPTGRQDKDGPSERASTELSRTSSGQTKKITFIDTPGHEAFCAIRSRGAKLADLAILVIDATEGVKDQTKEAIDCVKKAGIPLIVALNKMDKPGANPEKVKRELSQEKILVETMGGKVPSVEISAKTGKNIEELLEMILLIAEMEDLRGNIEIPAEGTVIEAYLDSQRGPVATLLINNGVLKLGDIIATASAIGKVKTLENFKSAKIEKAFPSMPAIVLGFEEVPQVGEKFKIFPSVESAQEYIGTKEKKENGQVFVAEEGKKILNLILKADVWGSLEAINDLLKTLPQEKVLIRILTKEVGDVGENDVKLAQSAKARILAFRVKINPVAQQLAEREGIKIIGFDIIYELSQGVRQLMEKALAPEVVRSDIGKVKVLAIFLTEKKRQIVGGRVTEGEIRKGVSIEVFRNDEKVGQGKLINLQRNKKDIGQLLKGDECGIMFEGNTKIELGDILVIFVEERRKGEL